MKKRMDSDYDKGIIDSEKEKRKWILIMKKIE